MYRYNPSYTKMIGALCGLGYDPETSRPLFAENDIEIVFDTMMDFNDLNQVYILFYFLSIQSVVYVFLLLLDK